MTTKEIIVIYNSTEYKIKIDTTLENLYYDFLQEISMQICEPVVPMKYKLTSINNSIPYLLIDVDNIKEIFDDVLPNGEILKLLLTKEDQKIEEINRESLIENLISGFNKNKNNTIDEDFTDDFAIINHDQDKIEEINNDENNNNKIDDLKIFEKDENILENNGKNENKVSDNKEKNNDNKEKEENFKIDENLDINTNINLNNNIIKDNNFNINDNVNINENTDFNINISSTLKLPNDKNNNLNLKKSNLTSNASSQLSLKKISLNIPKNIFENNSCSFCGKNIHGYKYVCAICDNCDLCEKCEDIHIHPCFKYKTKFLSTLNDTYKYIDKNFNFKIPIDSKKITKLIRKEYDLKIIPMTDLSFFLRPKKKVDIPVKILNLSKQIINSSQFIVLIKNNRFINLNYQCSKPFDIKPNESHIVNITCRTPLEHCKENINIEIYSTELNIRMSSRLNFDLNIEVNEDNEDEELNQLLLEGKLIALCNKEHKKKLINFFFSNDIKSEMGTVFNVLIENNWNAGKAMEVLKKLESKK